MKIALDARSMTALRPRGTGRNLLDAYRVIPGLRPAWQFILYHQRPWAEAAGATHPQPWDRPNVQLRHIDMPGDRFDAWFQLRLPLAARHERIDLLHFPANAAPAWCPVPFVVTIHDLIPLKLPEERSEPEMRAFRRGLLRSVRRAVHIITVSAATRDDLHHDFAVPLEKMTVIPWAADTRVASEADRAANGQRHHRVCEKYGLTERWLVSFSGSTPRKNAGGVLDGFARVRPDVRRGVQVVLVGCEPEAYRRQLATDAQHLGIASQCHILGFVPHEELPTLLGCACGLLMPSRYEGFGLPILDAFACGVPVLTSYVSSMPEVAGDAAVYCDPDNAASIATGIERLLNADAAAELVRRGHRRVAQFTWQRTAAAMCAVYDMCLAKLHLTPPPAAAERTCAPGNRYATAADAEYVR